MEIDLTDAAGNPMSRNIPQRSLVTTTGATNIYEILFSPTGEVIGQGTTGGKVLLWVRDGTVPNPYDPAAAAIISVQPRTGLIAAQPVGPAGDPYAYTKDATSSGM
jgi:hypothetical protein